MLIERCRGYLKAKEGIFLSIQAALIAIGLITVGYLSFGFWYAVVLSAIALYGLFLYVYVGVTQRLEASAPIVESRVFDCGTIIAGPTHMGGSGCVWLVWTVVNEAGRTKTFQFPVEDILERTFLVGNRLPQPGERLYYKLTEKARYKRFFLSSSPANFPAKEIAYQGS